MVHGHFPNRSLHKYGLKQENVFEYNWIMRKLERHNGKFASKAIFFFAAMAAVIATMLKTICFPWAF